MGQRPGLGRNPIAHPRRPARAAGPCERGSSRVPRRRGQARGAARGWRRRSQLDDRRARKYNLTANQRFLYWAFFDGPSRSRIRRSSTKDADRSRLSGRRRERGACFVSAWLWGVTARASRRRVRPAGDSRYLPGPPGRHREGAAIVALGRCRRLLASYPAGSADACAGDPHVRSRVVQLCFAAQACCARFSSCCW
jgi:hypothetical protein